MKWWISDFDGTLTLKENNYELIERDINFVKQWTKENKFIIATGRDIDHVNELVQQHGFDVEYKITNNGAAMFKGQKTLYELSIPMTQRQKIYDALKKLHNFCGIKLSDTLNAIEISGIKEEKPRYEATIVIPLWFEKEDKFDEYIETVLTNEKLNNVALYAHTQDFDYIRSLFKDLKDVKILHTSPFVLELMHQDVSKYTGIKYLQEKYNIDPKDIISSGDGDNDFEMLENVQNSFVMASGTKLALKAGKTIIRNTKREIGKYIN
ncbi:HAD-IIB family hydrolase [Spiroplasma floricola]|uniref:HAD superfamily hydrolase n=1 Tax=Spiroplasma floricola 23-6 TaxID=1336749 RepID=A0A2K8SEB0_9MOLU|nr:HAD-IIB family hydrolase [Spiroplasma floricola]AUB31806.1 hypothetical protein SFLOR_v1c07580 [Spiroplasma floricola 23-6]